MGFIPRFRLFPFKMAYTLMRCYIEKKPQQPEGTPLLSLFMDDGFKRNFNKLHDFNLNPTYYDDIPKEQIAHAIAEERELENILVNELIAIAQHTGLKKEAHAKAPSKGGKQTAKEKSNELNERNEKIVNAARTLLENKMPRHEIAGELAQSSYGLSKRQIRDILKKHNV